MDSYGFPSTNRLINADSSPSRYGEDRSVRDLRFLNFLKAINPSSSPILNLDSESFARLTTREVRELDTLAIAGLPVLYRIEVYLSLTQFVEGVSSVGEDVEIVASSGVQDAINRDLDRTFPGHDYFEEKTSQENLRQILVLFAAFNPSIGYCQGLNFIAGLFLLLTRNIAQSTHLLNVFVNEIMPEGYYSEKMEGQVSDSGDEAKTTRTEATIIQFSNGFPSHSNSRTHFFMLLTSLVAVHRWLGL